MISQKLFLFSFLALSQLAIAVVVYPEDNKRKAFPLPSGSGSARLDIYTTYPWHVKSSWIQARDSATLWQRVSNTAYTLANGHASEEYVG